MRYHQFKVPNQLHYFQTVPPIEYVNRYVRLFGLQNITDTREFMRCYLKEEKLNANGKKVINELTSQYLYPFKTKMFNISNSMNKHKYLTILRYLITFYGYNLFKYELILHGRKHIVYKVMKMNEAICNYTYESTKPKISIRHNVTTVFP